MVTKAKTKSSAAWFKRGDEGVQAKKNQDAIMKLRKEKNVYRFRIKDGEEAVVVFVPETEVDEKGKPVEGFFFWEHVLFDEASKQTTYITCTKDFAPCGTCESTGKSSTWTGYYTVIDTRKHTVKNGPNAGNVLKNQKVLFPAKGEAINMLADLRKANGGVLGNLAVLVKRYGAKSPNCGNNFSVAEKNGKRVGANGRIKLTKDNAVAYDYADICAAPSDEEMGVLGMSAHVAGSASDLDKDLSAKSDTKGKKGQKGKKVEEEKDGLDGLL